MKNCFTNYTQKKAKEAVNLHKSFDFEVFSHISTWNWRRKIIIFTFTHRPWCQRILRISLPDNENCSPTPSGDNGRVPLSHFPSCFEYKLLTFSLILDHGTIGKFRPGPDSSRVDWINWKRSFDIYARAKNVKSQQKLKDLLLHCGGPDLQSTYFLLPEATEEIQPDAARPYDSCIRLLDEFYAPKLNKQHETYLLRTIQQKADEKFDSFLQRIRSQCDKCEFPRETAELMIILQLIEGTNSIETRKKLLEKERTMDEAIKICKNYEVLKENLKVYEKDQHKITDNSTINRVINTRNQNTQMRPNTNVKCFNCGKFGHYAKGSNCPATNQSCSKCKKIGHFARMCRSGEISNNLARNQENFSGKRKLPFEQREPKRVKLIENTEVHEEEMGRNFVFFLGNKKKMKLKLGGNLETKI